jgi:hypothetical protein
MASTLEILKRLHDHQVKFVIVGGLAGVAHGSSLVTEDVDVCAPLDRTNLAKILAALDGINPRLRMSPNRPRLRNDPERFAGYRNLYLVTDLGQVNILSEITGIGDYRVVTQHTVKLELAGRAYHVLDLDALIQSRRALGRPKDIQSAMELEAIRRRLRDRHE